MAFHPFRYVWKHQRAAMAVLTIMTMVTFVLCTGAGGGFDSELIRRLTGRMYENDVASIGGQPITARELHALRFRRQLANLYMFDANSIAMEKRAGELASSIGDPSKSPENFQKIMQMQAQDPEMRILGSRVGNPQRPLDTPYFGGSLKTEGLLDFLVWQKEADRLGIFLTPADVNRAMSYLTFGRLSKSDSLRIEMKLRQDRRFANMTGDQLISVLADELRVRMAQEAMMGYEPGNVARVAAAVTPNEFYDFYRDKRTNIEVALIPFPVSNFVAQVKDKPDEEALRKLYNDFRDKEYSPQSKDPGFKRPRRIQMQWVAARPDSPHYQRAIPLIEATLQVGAALGNPPLWSGPDFRLLSEYEFLKANHFVLPSWGKGWLLNPRNHPHNENRSGHVAALMGQTLGAVGTQAPLYTAMSGFKGSGFARELGERAQFYTAWTLTGTALSPLPVLGFTLALQSEEKFLPLERVKNFVQDSALRTLTRRVLVDRLAALGKEVDKLGKAKGKQELDKKLEETYKALDLQHGGTTQLRDLFLNKLADDPGMAPFRKAFESSIWGDFEGRNQSFGPYLFNDKGPFVIEHWPRNPNIVRPEEDRLWATAPQLFLYWKTEDQAPTVVKYEEVKDRVLEAWRWQQARVLAKQEAERMAVKAKEKKGDRLELKEIANSLKQELIEPPALSPLVENKSTQGGIANTYRPPQFADSRIPYPDKSNGMDFAKELLKLKDKPPGDALVLPDAPEGSYYLAVLVKQSPPDDRDFYNNVYRNSAVNAVPYNPFFTQEFLRERQLKYRDNFLEELRKRNGLVVHEQARKNFEGESGSDEGN